MGVNRQTEGNTEGKSLFRIPVDRGYGNYVRVAAVTHMPFSCQIKELCEMPNISPLELF